MSKPIPKARANQQKTVAQQLKELIKQHIDRALPEHAHRATKKGNGMPLIAWMRGAPKHSASKINAVCEGIARYPYGSVGDGAIVLAKAIAERYDVTWVQLELIETYVLRRYRGKQRNRFRTWAGTVKEQELAFHNTFLDRNVLDQICKELKTSTHQLPLRALIDEQVTQMLLLLQLKETIERKTPAVCKI